MVILNPVKEETDLRLALLQIFATIMGLNILPSESDNPGMGTASAYVPDLCKCSDYNEFEKREGDAEKFTDEDIIKNGWVRLINTISHPEGMESLIKTFVDNKISYKVFSSKKIKERTFYCNRYTHIIKKGEEIVTNYYEYVVITYNVMGYEKKHYIVPSTLEEGTIEVDSNTNIIIRPEGMFYSETKYIVEAT